MITIEKLLCPVDFFPASHTAFKYATALAATHQRNCFKDTTNKTHPEDLCPESEFFPR